MARAAADGLRDWRVVLLRDWLRGELALLLLLLLDFDLALRLGRRGSSLRRSLIMSSEMEIEK